MRNTNIFLFDKEKMLIGKLTTKMYKPYSVNDKKFIEKNFYNLFKRKIYSSEGYVIDEKNKITNTIAYDNFGNIYLVLFKEKKNDNFFDRAKKDYDFLYENQNIFLEHISNKFKSPALFSNLKVMIISSCYSDKDITDAKNIDFPCELYSWQTVESLLLVSKKFANFKGRDDFDE